MLDTQKRLQLVSFPAPQTAVRLQSGTFQMFSKETQIRIYNSSLQWLYLQLLLNMLFSSCPADVSADCSSTGGWSIRQVNYRQPQKRPDWSSSENFVFCFMSAAQNHARGFLICVHTNVLYAWTIHLIGLRKNPLKMVSYKNTGRSGLLLSTVDCSGSVTEVLNNAPDQCPDGGATGIQVYIRA